MTSCEFLMFFLQAFQFDTEANVARCHYILNLELCQFCLSICVFSLDDLWNGFLKDAWGLICVLLWLRPSNYDFSCTEDQGCCPGLSDAHDHRVKSCGVVLSVAAPLSQHPEVDFTIHIAGGHQVVECWCFQRGCSGHLLYWLQGYGWLLSLLRFYGH